MKPLFIPAALLFFHQPLSAAEAWLLEMDARFHEALMKRFAEGDPVACRQVTDKLPELIASGKIKELESISTGSATGGKVHPKGTFLLKASDGTENPMKIGATYSGGGGPVDTRHFQIKSKGDGLGGTLEIKVSGRLGKTWQPVFSVVSAGTVRVLFERDTNAEETFWKPQALLTLGAPVPEEAAFTWILGEGHPLLLAGTEEANEFPGVAEFHEFLTRPAKSGDGWRNFGTDVKWSIDAIKGPSYDLSVAAEEKGVSTAARAFTTKGSLGKSAAPAKSPVTSYVEKFDKNGEHSNEDEKQAGVSEASLIRLR